MTCTAQPEPGGEAGMEKRSQEPVPRQSLRNQTPALPRTAMHSAASAPHSPTRTGWTARAVHPSCLHPSESCSLTPTRAQPRLPPQLLLQPPTPPAHTGLLHACWQNNTLLMITSAATSFVDFCRNFAAERMAGHDSKLAEWHLIFSKPSSDFS